MAGRPRAPPARRGGGPPPTRGRGPGSGTRRRPPPPPPPPTTPPAPAPAGAAQAPADNAAAADASTAPIAVDIADFAFAPKAIKAKVGQTITFTNKDSAPHTATATEGAKFDSGALDQGKSFSYTAKKAGTIQFVCSFHPNMTGTITVS